MGFSLVQTDTLPPPEETSDALELLQRQNEIDRALLRLQKECGIAFYRPHYYQHLFHSSSSKRRGLFAGNRFGKALVHGETVLTVNGFRRVETLQTGDLVFDKDGGLCPITGVFPQGKKECFRVIFDDETELEVSGDHLWLCKGPRERWHNGDWKVSSTQEIIKHVGASPYAKNRYIIPLTSPVDFPSTEVPIHPYLLGCLLGDGSITNSGLSLTSADYEIVERCTSVLPFGSKFTTNGYQHSIVGVHGDRGGTTNTLGDKLKTLGLLGKTSYDKFIPSVYLSNSVETRRNLLQGLMDTDGYVSGVACEYSTCSEKLARGVVYLLQSLGCKASSSLRLTKDQNGTECWSYRVRVRSPQDWMFFLPRKRKSCNNSETLLGRAIYKIVVIGSRDCTCISVGSISHTFLARSCIVTHNSQANTAETVAWMLGERPWYKTPFDVVRSTGVGSDRKTSVDERFAGHPNHPFVTSGIPPYPTKQLIITTNWDKVHEIWTSQESDRPGKLWQLLPKGFVKKAVRNHEGVIDEVYGTNGSLLKFQSVDAFKRNPQISESSDWDRCGLDEPAPEDMWKGTARGLVDRNGQGDFTLTSLQEMWIYDYFNSEETKEKVDRSQWRATIYDNPYLSNEAIARFAEDLTDEEKTCRLLGLPLELSGLVYKEFRRDTHVLKTLPEGWKDWHLPPRTSLLHCRVDPHPQTPNAVSFFALGSSGVPVQCHEIWLACDADTLASEVASYVRMTGCFLASLKMDPAAWVPDSVTRIASIAKTFYDHGLFATRASKDMTNGILKTRSCLKQSTILFAPTLRRTLWEIARYHYDKENKPIDRDDHMMENLRRLCIDTPLHFFDPDRAAGFPIGDAPFETADLSVNY